MARQLRQMTINYVEREDRLLLRVANNAEQEYRIWCTRRFTRLLLEHFESEFASEVAARAQAAAVPQDARREYAQMQHALAVKEESFQQPYEALPREYPLGHDGLLASSLKFGRSGAGAMRLEIGDDKRRGMSLNLDRSFQHQFYELLRRAAEKAEWFSARPAGSGVVH